MLLVLPQAERSHRCREEVGKVSHTQGLKRLVASLGLNTLIIEAQDILSNLNDSPSYSSLNCFSLFSEKFQTDSPKLTDILKFCTE